MLLEKETSENFPNNRKKILIVDDDETILYVLRRFFIGEGFEVLVARNGLEALERLKAENPALVLTDIKMPSFSGTDLIQFIRQNMKEIHIMAMTAYPHLYPEKRNGNEVDALKLGDNWRLIEKVLECGKEIDQPEDKFLLEVFRIIPDRTIYLDARILALDTLVCLFPRMNQGENQKVSRAFIVRNIRSILNLPGPPVLHEAITKSLEAMTGSP